MGMLNLLKKLSETSGAKDKQSLLESFLEHRPCIVTETAYLDFALSKHHAFGVTSIDDLKITKSMSKNTLDHAVFVLEYLKETSLGVVNETEIKLGGEALELVKFALEGHIKVGLGIKGVNRVLRKLKKDVIYDPSDYYMRCSSDFKKAKWDDGDAYIVQEKLDGSYVKATNNTFETRNGKQYSEQFIKKMFGDDDSFAWLGNEGLSLLGELLVYENGILLPREASNGILNSMRIGTADEEVYSRYKVVLVAFDIVAPTSNYKGVMEDMRPLESRMSLLEDVTKYIADEYPIGLEMVNGIVTHDKNEVMRFYSKIVFEGGEGVVVKRPNSIWRAGTSKDWYKIKRWCDVDLVVTDFVEGNKRSKNAQTFGSLRCESSCGKVVVNVSGGLTDANRAYYSDNRELLQGKVITVLANSLVKGDGEVYSLFLPQLVKDASGDILIRDDKDVADSLERVQDIFGC